MSIRDHVCDLDLSADIDNAVAYVLAANARADRRRYLLGFHAYYSAAVAALRTITVRSGAASGPGVLVAATVSRGGNFNVQTTVVQHQVGHRAYFKAAVVAGTALPVETIPADLWGTYNLHLGVDGTYHITPAADNTVGYASEALALAAVPATPALHTRIGRVAILTAAGQPFICGTDALEGGAGGNVSADTNYYADAAVIGTVTELAWQHLFTNGPCYVPFPAPIQMPVGAVVSVELAASGAGGITGTLAVFSKAEA